MKDYLKNVTLVTLTLGAALDLHSQGFIVPNGVTAVPFGNSFGVQVLQHPTNGNYTGFLLDPQSSTTFQYERFLDEGVRTFKVSLNDSISLQPILAGNYPELTFPNIYLFPNLSTFYLGFYTGSSFPVNGVYNDPLFGWGHFRNLNGTISLLDGALEYGGGGIFAGTQTIVPIPEPSTWALLTLGSALFWCAVRRRKI